MFLLRSRVRHTGPPVPPQRPNPSSHHAAGLADRRQCPPIKWGTEDAWALTTCAGPQKTSCFGVVGDDVVGDRGRWVPPGRCGFPSPLCAKSQFKSAASLRRSRWRQTLSTALSFPEFSMGPLFLWVPSTLSDGTGCETTIAPHNTGPPEITGSPRFHPNHLRSLCRVPPILNGPPKLSASTRMIRETLKSPHHPQRN